MPDGSTSSVYVEEKIDTDAIHFVQGMHRRPECTARIDAKLRADQRQTRFRRVECNGVWSTTCLAIVTRTWHVALSRERAERSTVGESVATVTFRRVFQTGKGESTLLTEGGALLNSHVVGNGRSTGECSTGDLLNTSLFGVLTDLSVGVLEVGVLEDGQCSWSPADGTRCTRALHVARSCSTDGSAVNEIVTTVALSGVFGTSVLHAFAVAESNALGVGHIVRSGASTGKGSSRGTFDDANARV